MHTHPCSYARFGNICCLLALMGLLTAVVAAVPDDTLRLFFWQAPTILNPYLTGAFKDLEAARIAYEPLASFDQNGALIPCLAAEIPSLTNGGVAPDGLSVTWKLKPGLKWSDGQPCTADDILFTYQFVTTPAVKAVNTTLLYAPIERVAVLDDLTVTIHFRSATPGWFLYFVGRDGVILPRHIFEAYANDQARQAPANLKPVGTGPYRVVDYLAEDMLMIGADLVNVVKIAYEPNPFYREPERIAFRRVELQGGGDASMAARAVLTEGSADFAWNVQLDPGMLAAWENSGKGRMVDVPGAAVERIILNRTDPNRATETGERSSLRFPHPILSDKKVRQALAHAIDRPAIAALYGATARLTTNILVSPTMYNSANTAHLYPFDLARAAALLDEAGWQDTDGDGIRDKDGLALRLLYQTSVTSIRQQTQQIVKQALERIGMAVELNVVDASIFFSADPAEVTSGRHFYADLEAYYTGNSSPDPTGYMRGWMCDQILQQANNWSGGANLARWCDPEYDALAEQMTKELDMQKRTDLLRQLNDWLIADVAVIPLVNRSDVHGVSATLDGLTFTPWDASTWQIADWRRK